MPDGLTDRLPTSNSMLIIALGDLIAIAAFVAIGEVSHGSPVLAGTGTFVAFAIGWLVVALIANAYRETALASPRRAAGVVAVAWIPAVLLGQVIRLATVSGARLAPTFVVVSVVVVGGFLLLWRVAAAIALGRITSSA